MAAAAQAAPAVAVSPLNGTPDASPYTQISFLGVAASEITRVSVVGSSTGSHSGSLKSYASATGASFLPTHRFAQGESVTASATVGPRGHTATVRTTFTVARLAPYSEPQGSQKPLTRTGLVQTFHSSPHLEPPSIFVTADSDAAAPGDIFLTPSSGYGQRGAMIIDRHGRLIFHFHVPARKKHHRDLGVLFLDRPRQVPARRAGQAQVGHDYIGPFTFEYPYPFRRVRRHQDLMSEIFQYLDKGLSYALFIFYNQDLRHQLPP